MKKPQYVVRYCSLRVLDVPRQTHGSNDAEITLCGKHITDKWGRFPKDKITCPKCLGLMK